MLKSVAMSFALLLGYSVSLCAAPLQLYTEEYAPVSFSRAGKAAGMATEVVEEILRRQGQAANIQVVPWARGYQTVLRTPDSALFATIRSTEREASFQWVGPILQTHDGFYALKGSGLVIRTQAELAAAGQIAGSPFRNSQLMACPICWVLVSRYRCSRCCAVAASS